jgi:proteasome lid subunit RPN8/RPN11
MIWHKLKKLWQFLTHDLSIPTSPKFIDLEMKHSSWQDDPQENYSDGTDLIPLSNVMQEKTAITQVHHQQEEDTQVEVEAPSSMVKYSSFKMIQELKSISLPQSSADILPPRLQTPLDNFVSSSLPRQKTVQLPNFVSIVPQKVKQPVSTRLDQVVWHDCVDVYRPVKKPMEKFLQESRIDLADVDLAEEFSPVYVQTEAYQNILKHLKLDVEREQGGILFGNAYEDPQKGIYVKIVNAIPAPNTFGSKVHLQFTAKTWQGIMDYAKEIYPYENIVGWYHSHPNIGVFMSHTDMKTQESFFYHPWCLSIVYDPVRHEIGFFLGKKARAIYPVIFSSTLLS